MRERNSECSAHAMKTEAALRVWQRSQEHANLLLFGVFLSDGNSKAHNTVVDAYVYEGAVEIQKEESTNHVAKHLCNNIRKVKEPLHRGEKLKEPVIQTLRTYY